MEVQRQRTAQAYDAIVVGAGPGGTTAATVMAREGVRVLLLDKARFPRDKICGDAISGKSVDVLKKLDLVESVRRAESLDSWGCIFGGPFGDTVEIPFTKALDRPVPPGYICARVVFDNLLFEKAVETGVEVWQEATVEDLLREDERVVGVRLRRGRGPAEAVRAPVVVGADGAYSVVARRLGFDQLDENHYFAGVRAYYEGVEGFHRLNFIELHFVEDVLPGYFWIFPMAGGRANVGLGTLSAHVKKRDLRLKALLDEIIAQPRFRDRFAGAERVSPVKGWGLPLGSRPRPMAGAGWLLVGDAASLIDPFSGEGIGNAMVSGELAGQWAVRAVAAGDASAALLSGYERAVLGLLRPELRLSHTMQRLGNWKWLLNTVIRKAARSPELASVISSMFDSIDDRSQLASPRFYLRVLTA